jgi:hypothetical protein
MHSTLCVRSKKLSYAVASSSPSTGMESTGICMSSLVENPGHCPLRAASGGGICRIGPLRPPCRRPRLRYALLPGVPTTTGAASVNGLVPSTTWYTAPPMQSRTTTPKTLLFTLVLFAASCGNQSSSGGSVRCQVGKVTGELGLPKYTGIQWGGETPYFSATVTNAVAESFKQGRDGESASKDDLYTISVTASISCRIMDKANFESTTRAAFGRAPSARLAVEALAESGVIIQQVFKLVEFTDLEHTQQDASVELKSLTEDKLSKVSIVRVYWRYDG